MGGPSRESYQAADKAKRRRLDAMRTRDGVVDLAEWRAAVRAAQWIEVIFETAPSFLGARVALAERAGFELHVVLLWDDRQLRACFPSSVNEVPVVIDVRNASRLRGS
jgi:hypothetical protein